MTQTSLLRVFGVLAISMLLMVSGAALAQADTNYNEPVSVDTSVDSGAGGAGDATTPGVPNTGPATADNTMWFVGAVVAIGLIGAAVYYMAAPRRSEVDL